MNIAIPIWDDCVSNAFDFAARLLLVETESDSEVSRSHIRLESQSLSQRVSQLKYLEVDVLVCGAISRTLTGMVKASGIEVLPYVTGSVDDILKAYLTGQLAKPEFSMPGCWSGARKGFGRRRRGCKRPEEHDRNRKEKGKIMKIAITSQGKELSSEIDLRFGRAKWLIVFDLETGDFQAHDNELNLNAAQGAGIQTGRNIANLGADAVITGNVGPNAFKTLAAAKVKVFLAEKQTVQQAIDSYKAGELKEVNQANVKGHWS